MLTFGGARVNRCADEQQQCDQDFSDSSHLISFRTSLTSHLSP
jgi:hypothetical protein